MERDISPFVVSDSDKYCTTLQFYIVIHYYKRVLEKRGITIPELRPVTIDNQNHYVVKTGWVRDIWEQILNSVFAFSNWEVSSWNYEGKCSTIQNSPLAEYMNFRKERKQLIQKFFEKQDTRIQEALFAILFPVRGVEEPKILMGNTFQIYYRDNVLSYWKWYKMNPNYISALLILHDLMEEAEGLFGYK